MSSIPIKNHTSNVPSEVSIMRIEAKLAAAGATGLMKEYGPDKRVSALMFRFDIPYPGPGGVRSFAFRVPAKVGECNRALWEQHCLTVRSPKEATRKTILEQAERTAWRLAADWIDIQITYIALKQVEFLEVFMPFAWDGKQTYYEQIKSNQFKALPEKTT